jgi:hypothetical protein
MERMKIARTTPNGTRYMIEPTDNLSMAELAQLDAQADAAQQRADHAQEPQKKRHPWKGRP